MKYRKGAAAFVEAAIRHRKAVYAVVAVLAIAGIVSLEYMKKDEFPSFIIKQGLVVGIYPGASVQEVEQQLTVPLEDILISVPEVDRKTLRSVTKEGICYIYTDLTCEAKRKDEVWSRIKLKLQAGRASLPAGVPGVIVLDDFSSLSSVLIAMQSDDKSHSELKEYADELCRELRHIPELSNVSVLGTQKEEVAVIVDRDQLSSYAISPSSLIFQYQMSSAAIPSGTYRSDNIRAPVHVKDNMGTEMEVAERIVYSDNQGNVVRLKDIAKVEKRVKEPESYITFNEDPCLVISVGMRHGNNIVSFGHDVDKVISDFSEDLPESISLTRISDQPKIVDNSVRSFLSDLLYSMIVVILVMLVLFPLKSALIAGSGVPICTSLTLVVMYITGMDLNTVTLAALIVVLGMIVDNSIITMDAYIVKLKEGYESKDAAVRSIQELFAPTFAATLAICAMFFPIKYILSGYLGDFVKLLPWVIAVALMISLGYAITVVPSLEMRYIKISEDKGFFESIQDKMFRRLEGIYAVAEDFCFRHPVITIGTGVGTLVVAFICFMNLNVQMMPKAARDYFAIELEVEGKNGMIRTKEVADSLQSMLLADPRVRSVTSFVGVGAPRFTSTYAPVAPDRLKAQMIVNTESIKATEQILREYESKHEHIFPDALLRYKQIDYQAVDAPVAVTLTGEDRMELLEAAGKIKGYMMSMESELMWVHGTADQSEPVITVIPDPEESARLGINEAMLSLSLSGTFDGVNIATIWEGGKAVPVNIYADFSDGGSTIDEIGNNQIPTSIPGMSVPLRQVASVQAGWQPVMLERYGAEESVSIYADMKYSRSQPSAVRKIRKFIDSDIRPTLPPGTEIEYRGLTAMNRNVIPEVTLAVLAAVFVLIVFMVFHFRKLSLALLTLVMSTLCFFGAFLGLWMFDLDFGLTAILGVISLIGIIVRNGILMYEYAEELRFKDGYSVKDAAVLAGRRRMRPIFLTSCTTALGVLPMVTGGDLLWQPMGVVICFGTLLSIALVVLIMPVSYWIVFRNSNGFSKNRKYDED